MVDAKEVAYQIIKYMGTDNVRILQTITESERELFKSKKIDLRTSYFVRGDKEILKKFKSYYLFKCNEEKERRKSDTKYFTEYAQYLKAPNEDDIGVPELLFLYVHKHDMNVGNSELWLSKIILDNIANRERKGFTTIVLSERSVPDIEKSRELKRIVLTNASGSSSESYKNIESSVDSSSTCFG